MHIRPILSSLRRHRLVAGLLVLLVAFTCAIVCNVAFMITRQAEQMRTPSGVADDSLVLIQSFTIARGTNPVARHRTDLAALRTLAGVNSAVAVNTLPFIGNDWSTSLSANSDNSNQVQASVYNGTPGELDTLGLKLVAGRDFQADEYLPRGSAHGDSGLDHVGTAILTRALAARLFPGKRALGQLIYSGDHAITVVGVVQGLLRPGAGNGPDNNFSVLLPMLPDRRSAIYVLNTTPHQRGRVIKRATDVLNHIDHNRVVRGKSFTTMRAEHYQRTRTMIGLLIAAALGLLVVTAIGITGLGSFWVQQRTRSIGIRRAIGARRSDILHYFQAENFLIVGTGVLLGVILAVGLNLLLMHQYELPRLPLWYLAVGAMALWLLGQLAVLGPALRAARVPPAVATRSV